MDQPDEKNMTSYSILKTSLVGDLLLVANSTQLIGIYFSECEHAPAVQSDWKLDPAHPVLEKAAGEIQEYIQGKRTTFSVPLHFAGTDFQGEIWRQIARIPFGETITYTELAGRAGVPKALRAAGTATGKNPFSLIIPCHRVVGKNGLGGYAGGLDRKRSLLAVENKELLSGVVLSTQGGSRFGNRELSLF
jgi:methylated-DNA-[protein]-cysteine S-methyltransferase